MHFRCLSFKVLAHKEKIVEEARIAEDKERERLEWIECNGFEDVEPLGYKRDAYSYTQTWTHVEAS